jgi:hypothetical protein
MAIGNGLTCFCVALHCFGVPGDKSAEQVERLMAELTPLPGVIRLEDIGEILACKRCKQSLMEALLHCCRNRHCHGTFA